MPSGNTRTGKNAFGTKETTQVIDSVVYAKMTIGDYAADLEGRNTTGYVFHAWSNAACEIVTKADRWIQDNGAKVSRKLRGGTTRTARP